MTLEKRPYDRNDNDTYVEIYSYNPSQDAEVHMFQDPNAHVRGVGGLMGNYSVESQKKAEGSVLQFATATEVGLVNIKKSITVKSPLPMSLVTRYKLKASSICHSQSIPVFFDPKKERFVILMDRRFLRDVGLGELELNHEDLRKDFKVYTPAKGSDQTGATEYLGLLFDNLEAIRAKRDEKSPLALLIAAYQRYNLRIEDGEKVILLRIARDKDGFSMLDRNKSFTRLGERILRHSLHFELCVAYRFGDTCYLQAADGGVDQGSNFVVQKERDQRPRATGMASLGQDEESDLLVLPYSDEQYELLSRIHARMAELAADLVKLTKMHQQPGDKLDAPVTLQAMQIGRVSPLLLE